MTVWMTQREAAAHLRCSVRHLQRMPVSRSYLGRSPRYSREGLDEYMALERVKGPPPKRRAALRLGGPVGRLQRTRKGKWLEEIDKLLAG